jgi:ACR3 family arsenite transporter
MSEIATISPGRFKSWLSLWIALAMALGLALGSLFPDPFKALGSFSIASVNPVTAFLVWLLILPTMVQIDYSKLASVWSAPDWRAGSAITLIVNWLIKPFSLALLALLFLKTIFGDFIPTEDADQYVAGLILLGIAPCTGMVFVWSRMTGGDAAFTLAQVSLNDLVLLIAFAPIAGLLLGLTGIAIPWLTLGLSTLAYVIVPLVGGYLLRRILIQHSDRALAQFDNIADPMTKFGLILLVVLLFGFQADVILSAPLVIGMIAVPLLLQSFLIFAIAYGAAWTMRLPNQVAAPAALIGVSNFFELAVAVAIMMFGGDSPAVTATVVGVLVEVPVMLLLVAFANRVAPAMSIRARKQSSPS